MGLVYNLTFNIYLCKRIKEIQHFKYNSVFLEIQRYKLCYDPEY